MGWNLKFISEDDFVKHVGATIEKYGEFHIKEYAVSA
jgi:hypothetical protein